MIKVLPNSTLPIVKYSIYGLHHEKSIIIPFSDPTKILVSENGVGKTTVLNTLYYTLTCQFDKLALFDFDNIEIEFPEKDGKKQIAKIYKNKLSKPLKPTLRVIAQLEDVLKHILHQSEEQISKFLPSEEPDAQKIIKENFSTKVLHFPTYRRIEEDLSNLGYSLLEQMATNRPIQFGMQDVANKINEITQEIKNSSVKWFSKISGEMLGKLIAGLEVNRSMKERLQKDQETLGIVLDRIGENILPETKEYILDIVKSANLFENTDIDPLVFFLDNLINAYNDQRKRDNAIKNFRNVCNQYLKGKRIDYNESQIHIEIISETTKKPLDLKYLSSGEKQIISLFSRLYLDTPDTPDTTDKYVVLFDEPELSLSLDWQKRLLPDIVASSKCALLLVATHSPFIFQNDLDQFAANLSDYIEEV